MLHCDTKEGYRSARAKVEMSLKGVFIGRPWSKGALVLQQMDSGQYLLE